MVNDVYNQKYPTVVGMIERESDANIRNLAVNVLNASIAALVTEENKFAVIYDPAAKSYAEAKKISYTDLRKELMLNAVQRAGQKYLALLSIAVAVGAVAFSAFNLAAVGVATFLVSRYLLDLSLSEMKIKAALKYCEEESKIADHIEELKGSFSDMNPAFRDVEEGFYFDLFTLIRDTKLQRVGELLKEVTHILSAQKKLLDANGKVYVGALTIILKQLENYTAYGLYDQTLKTAEAYIKNVNPLHLNSLYPPYVDVMQSVENMKLALGEVIPQFYHLEPSFFQLIYTTQCALPDRTKQIDAIQRQFVVDVAQQISNQKKLFTPSGEPHVQAMNLILQQLHQLIYSNGQIGPQTLQAAIQQLPFPRDPSDNPTEDLKALEESMGTEKSTTSKTNENDVQAEDIIKADDDDGDDDSDGGQGVVPINKAKIQSVNDS